MSEFNESVKDPPDADDPQQGNLMNGPNTAADDAGPGGSTSEAAAGSNPTASGQSGAPNPLLPHEGGTGDPRFLQVDPDELARWNEQVKRRMRQQTRRSFLVGGAAALAGVAGWHWLQSRREEGSIPWPFRQALELNEHFGRDYYRRDRLAPDFRGRALQDRVNGDLGLEEPVGPRAWRLSVAGLQDRDEPLELPLDAIKQLHRVEMTAEFKCIEGWSVVVQWAGARFSDFMAAYPPATLSGDPLDLEGGPEDLPPYVGMETPDGGYYVGLDIESMLHPQTLLAYEMNGAPLTQEHGAPLRLVTPVKYGVKNIKRIGTIRYSRVRPADYWGERGYDWYIGL